jgi:predicted permease
MWRDLVHAVRSLAKARAFTFVCVMSLGIGMAPVIAVPYYTRVFTTPLPGVNPDGLVEIVTTRIGPRAATDDWSYPDYIDLRDADTGVSMTGWAGGQTGVILPASGEVRTTPTMYVGSNYFSTIGMPLARGSGFPGANEATEPVVILGHDFWQRRLGADPDIVGKSITLDKVPHVVVGITGDPFVGHLFRDDPPELFVPLERHPRLVADTGVRFDRNEEWVRIHGRLAPGVAIGQASAAVAAVTSRLAREYPATNDNKAGMVAPYHPLGSLEGEDAIVIITLWQTMSLMPLLVVCLNVSGMVQVRGAIRERELSIRQAIGASRGRLLRHLLAEAVILAALGGALAALAIFSIPPVMSWWFGEPIPIGIQEALRVDLVMIVICVGVCLATSLVFGWLPAARFSRPVILTVLKDDAGGGGVRTGRLHRVAAALQVAVAVPPLVLGAISLDRVRATATADLGFACDLLYAAPLRLEAVAAEGGARMRRVRDNLAQTPGVAAVTVADGLPLDFRYRMARVSLKTGADVAPRIVAAHVTRVGDGYLQTMGIQLLRGRTFSIDDAAGGEMVTVISKALADELFPDDAAAEPIGQQLTFGVSGGDRTPQTLTIVGVSADFPTSQMSTERAQLLLPLAQHPDVRRDSVPVEDDRSGATTVMVVARSAPGEPSKKLTAAVENAIREIDPEFEPQSIVTGVSMRQQSIDDFLNQSIAGGTIGGVILLLAALGIYGVVGLMVSTRTREIAVRVTLGASRLRVIGMILYDVIKLVGPGVVVGLVLTFVLVRLDGGILISKAEPLAYVAGAAIAILTAVFSGLAPARRAASVQPMVAMRSV